jgi:hypothetical protein
MVGENQIKLMEPNFMKEMVDRYNSNLHAAFNYKFTPKQVQMNPDLEEYFIRENLDRLAEAKTLQREAGFFDYRPGNVLLIHLDKSKTKEGFDKKRRAFNELALFVQYQNGNVVCDRLARDGKGKIIRKLNITPKTNVVTIDRIVIPIYFTKFVCASLDDLPDRYQQLVF